MRRKGRRRGRGDQHHGGGPRGWVPWTAAPQRRRPLRSLAQLLYSPSCLFPTSQEPRRRAEGSGSVGAPAPRLKRRHKPSNARRRRRTRAHATETKGP